MVIKNCVYKGCRNDSRYKDREYMDGIFFIRFPNIKSNIEKCNRWISACARPEFLTLEALKKRMFICSFHFLGGAGPTEENPDPLPFHDYCIDDTHETCKIEISKEPREETELIKEPSLTFEKCSMSIDKSSLILEVVEPKLNLNQDLNIDEPSSVVIEPALSKIEPILTVTDLSCDTEPSLMEEQPCLGGAANKFQLDHLLSSIATDATDLLKKFIHYQYFASLSDLIWTVSRNVDSCLSIFKVNSPHYCAIEIKIQNNLGFEILIYGKALEKHHSLFQLETFPKTAATLGTLLDLLDYINSLTVCEGSGLDSRETRYNKKFGHANVYTRILHSTKCEGLVKNETNPSCKNCKGFKRAQLAKQKRAKLKELNTLVSKKGPRNYRAMSREDLVAALSEKNRQNREKDRQIKQLKKTIKTLKQSLSEEPNFLFGEAIDEDSFCTKENFLRLLLKEQLKLLKNNRKKPKQWHPAIIKWCLYLRTKSPSAYENLREVLPLPASRTLWKYSSIYSTKSGFTTETMTEMRGKIDLDSCDEHQKYFSLIVDEMKIKEDLIYKASTGEIVGFSHSSESGDMLKKAENARTGAISSEELPIASHVMALMVRGLTTNFKHTLAYFPCHDMKTDELYLIIQEAIEILENHGFKVLTVVCDKSAVNQKLIKLCTRPDPETNVHYKAPNIYAGPGEERNIYFISDPPHLMKTVRNCFSKSGTEKKTRFLRKNNKNILWSHVVEMYKKDCSSQLRLCPKLTDNHIYINPFSAMKVKLATQILSNTVAEAVDELVGEEASETVKFLKIFNSFFDILNSRNISQGKFSRNAYIEPFRSTNDWRFTWLEETFLGYLRDWAKEANEADVPEEGKLMMQLSRETIEGIHTTVYSIIEAVKFLLRNGAMFVLTDKFNQDPLERHFGKHRRAVGCHENPSLLAYSYTERKFKIMRVVLSKPRNGNCARKKKKV